MSRGGQRADGTRAQRNRLRALESAIALFAEKGYDATALERIAAGAGLSVGVVCRHFPTKEHFAMALYDRLATELSEWAAEMPAGTASARFGAVMRKKLALLEPHRPALVALASRAIDPRARAHVFGPEMDVVRSKVSGVFWAAVSGASDAPPPAEAAVLARLLYGAHLAMVLLYLQERAPAAGASREVLALVEAAFSASPMLVALLGGPLGQRIDGVLGGLFGTSRGTNKEDLARMIATRLFRNRRVLPGTPPEPSEAALAIHLPRIVAFLEANEPIELVLPAFPAKAPNPAKVLGTLPDGAEWVALETLGALLRDIAEAHPPGATLVICSDGHVFADAVGVPDADVAAYRKALQVMIAELGAPNIRVFGLEDAFDTKSPAAARKLLFDRYALSVDDIRARAAAHPLHAAQLDGIHRFLFEDEIGRGTSLSRTQVRKQTRERAYEVVRRSDAWGALVDAAFPRALRLSIHPQPDVSPKIGVHLLPSDDAWLTPWHGVLCVDGDRARLMRRRDAEELGAVVVHDETRADHMDLRR